MYVTDHLPHKQYSATGSVSAVLIQWQYTGFSRLHPLKYTNTSIVLKKKKKRNKRKDYPGIVVN